MDRLKIATVWLGGCSGCHMSFLDMDEWLIDLAAQAELVYSPIMDVKQYPEGVDVVLVEGAVANEDHLEMALTLRRHTRIVVSFGDCAVNGNVTAMRNPLGKAQVVLDRAYVKSGDLRAQVPAERGIVPPLLDRVLPLHEVIEVDQFLQGCPPPAGTIRALLERVLEAHPPVAAGSNVG
jgi:NAD-reducing hydrogenase small subunit